jgi:hydroxypyruvate reductase
VALGAAQELDGLSGVVFISLATDGEDGPTDSAGAVVTGQTLLKARALGLDAVDFLHRNDSYHFFEPLDALIRMGPTGTNVNDLNFLFTC